MDTPQYFYEKQHLSCIIFDYTKVKVVFGF